MNISYSPKFPRICRKRCVKKMGGRNFEWRAIERMKKDSTIDARICSPKC